ncbi:hypothetical protein N7520_010415 [Penicillium odoratum]|uniref:uncharacterized protein n=1 Tax=Penicillium odoratum TaxID=1167516 RepID=UPI002548BE5F|nr:uncharacterized protein N7520_010415 [Penicillium odoratum]KAJ5745233.1 hypothetical protein N7520_010415 [Penicillium odoratum]
MQLSPEYTSPTPPTNVLADSETPHPSPQSPSVSVIIHNKPMPQIPLPTTQSQSQFQSKSPEQGHTYLSKKRPRQSSAEEDRDTTRKHGKRLTTREEVSLFEICIRHAPTFGKRSDICNWWRGVAEEFTRAHGRPYSWHSVRRKVEIVTRQRVKFLEDKGQQDPGSGTGSLPQISEASMNPEWCAVLDLWTPTWVRFQEAEAIRIEKRDEMIRRRRSQASLQQGREESHSEGHGVGHGGTEEGETLHEDRRATVAPPVAYQFLSLPAGVKLPPGFESMYSNSSLPAIRPRMPNNPPNKGTVNTMETLRKLNMSPDRQASPVLSPLVQAASESSASLSDTEHRTNVSGSGSLDIERIKEELRREMQVEIRRELDRDRAVFQAKLDSVQRTQEMILQMLRQQRS